MAEKPKDVENVWSMDGLLIERISKYVNIELKECINISKDVKAKFIRKNGSR